MFERRQFGYTWLLGSKGRCQDQICDDLRIVKARFARLVRGQDESLWLKARLESYLSYFADPSNLSEDAVLGAFTDDDIAKAAVMPRLGEFVGVDKEDGRAILISRYLRFYSEGASRVMRRPSVLAYFGSQLDRDGQPKEGESPCDIDPWYYKDKHVYQRSMEALDRKGGRMCTPIEMRDSVRRVGFELPPDSPSFIRDGSLSVGEGGLRRFNRQYLEYYVWLARNFHHFFAGNVERIRELVEWGFQLDSDDFTTVERLFVPAVEGITDMKFSAGEDYSYMDFDHSREDWSTVYCAVRPGYRRKVEPWLSHGCRGNGAVRLLRSSRVVEV